MTVLLYFFIAIIVIALFVMIWAFSAAAKERAKLKNSVFVGFGEAVGNFFKGYFDFRGTATRAEYWWIILLIMIAAKVLNVIQPELATIMFLVINIPFIMLPIRRMHDIGKSGWLFYAPQLLSLMILIMFRFNDSCFPIALFLLLAPMIWTLLPSKLHNNKYRDTTKKDE